MTTVIRRHLAQATNSCGLSILLFDTNRFARRKSRSVNNTCSWQLMRLSLARPGDSLRSKVHQTGQLVLYSWEVSTRLAGLDYTGLPLC